jgi:hypothetical protein
MPEKEQTRTTAERLAIAPGSTLWCSDPEHLAVIGALPDGVRTVRGIEDATTALLFAGSGAAARALLDEHGAELAAPAALWVAYPQGNEADINRDTLWPMLTTFGLRPALHVDLDETWSALLFRPLRDGERFGQG